MKEWYIEFYIGNTLHQWVEEAENQLDAIVSAINRIPKSTRHFVSGFKVERKFAEWN